MVVLYCVKSAKLNYTSQNSLPCIVPFRVGPERNLPAFQKA